MRTENNIVMRNANKRVMGADAKLAEEKASPEEEMYAISGRSALFEKTTLDRIRALFNAMVRGDIGSEEVGLDMFVAHDEKLNTPVYVVLRLALGSHQEAPYPAVEEKLHKTLPRKARSFTITVHRAFEPVSADNFSSIVKEQLLEGNGYIVQGGILCGAILGIDMHATVGKATYHVVFKLKEVKISK